MKKLLIYMAKEKIRPVGGPSGYLFNLMNNLKNGKIEVSFLNGPDHAGRYRRIYDRLPVFFKNIYRTAARTKSFHRLFKKNGNLAKADLSLYQYVHFHSCEDLFSARDSLKNYNGTIILTSHTPKPQHLEIVEDNYSGFEKMLFGRLRLKKLEQMVEYSFNTADYIFFPCRDAEEPYHNNWMKYGAVRERNEAKFRYILSGTRQCAAKTAPLSVRAGYNIPADAFVVCYIGRHNSVKGYDTLKTIGETLLFEADDLYFLIAGAEEPLKGLKHTRWIEAGWTSDPHSLMNAADVFILCNKETYFDLVLLEALSLGKIIIASNTGGNRYFGKIRAEGILLFNETGEAAGLIRKVRALPADEREAMSGKNRDLYRSRFNDKLFADNYIDLIDSLEGRIKNES